MQLLPPFDFHTVFVETWTENLPIYGWVMLMGFFTSAGLGLIGNYIILRKQALIGDAISHSILPGIVIAFLVTQSRATLPMMVGAAIAGLLTVLFIEAIHKHSRVKADAATGIVFSTLFALGVVLITLFADHVDLDADCVLYGELGFIIFEDPLSLAGHELGPMPVWRSGVVLLFIGLMILFFYKELLVTSFDAGLANALGIPASIYHYALMIVLSLVIVTAFESSGAILVIAMLIFPGATATLISDRLGYRLLLTVLLSAAYAVGGLHLGVWLDTSIAAANTVVAGFIFSAVWIVSYSMKVSRLQLIPEKKAA